MSPISCGMPSDSAGIYVTAISIANMTTKYGSKVFVTSSMLILLIPQPTNKTEPTGGVMFPKHMLNISITPNWMSLMPRLCAMGRKIGVNIRMAGVMSMNIPTTIRMTFINKKMIILLDEMDMMPSLIAAGIPEYAMTNDIAEEAEIKNRMMPLVHALFTNIFMNDFKVMLL